jgi:RNA polymerase sigma-70 factor (ECF subfamily)
MHAPAGDPGPLEPGDDAVAALYDRFGPALYRTARTLLGGSHLAEDAVQETFVGLVRARVAPTDLENAKAYLFAALRHAAAKLHARQARERSVPPNELPDRPGPRPPDMDRAADLERAVRSLPADQREVIALKIDGGLTFAEVAACLGVSPNTAASRYRYALEKLRAALGEADRDA